MTPIKQEEDAWWGSCSIKSILPGIPVCLTGSMFILAVSWLFPRGGVEQSLILSFLCLIWAGLLAFWVYRVFGHNYRLTTCRLFVEIGLRHRQVQAVELTKVSSVAWQANPVEKFLGIGRVIVQVLDFTPSQIVLHGVPGPELIVEKISDLVKKAGKPGQ